MTKPARFFRNAGCGWLCIDKGVIRAVWVMIAFLPLFSCTAERQPCLTPKTASLNIKCVHFSTDTATTTVDTALPMAVFGALTAKGTQSVIYKGASSAFTISLSPVADSCQWLVTTDSLNFPFDTLGFYYERKLKFLSNACGYTYFYALTSVTTTHNNIDSVIITNPSVTNDVNTKQLKIYIHPSF
ncbi:MAG: hypothetical protein H7257_00875 [Taibaiella sp.]|nr:hypothetical protein [Taibaiella sp.]